MNLIRRLEQVALDEGISGVARRTWKRLIASMRIESGILASHVEGRILSTDWGFIRHVRPDLRGREVLIRSLQRKPAFAFPFSDAERPRFLERLRCQYPEEVARTLAGAEAICLHRFSMLGQSFSFPDEPIAWNAGPPGCKPWPRCHVKRLAKWFWSEQRPGDWLPVWELNRHQFFGTLGTAYWLSGEERYVREFCGQLESWTRTNPYEHGVNWFSPMEVSVRLISWATAFFMFRESPLFRQRAAMDFLKSLYQQARYVRLHLTLDWRVQNNWIISQAVGLLTIGALFPEFTDSEDWVRTGLGILEREADLQTFDDGVNKEQATGYHHYVLDLLMFAAVLGRRGAYPRSALVERVAERMLEYVLYAMAPDGRLPQFGDTDEGWGFKHSERTDYWDLKPWLAVGAVLFDRPDFKFGSGGFSEEAFWLLGEGGLSAYQAMSESRPRLPSRAFWKGGHYFLRDDWTTSSDYLMIRAGEFGLGGEGACAHAHCDLLSFVLWIGGKPLIVDSGTYTYDGKWRDPFRLTSAHNTIRVDGRDQAVPQRNFCWNEVPKAACESFDAERMAATLFGHGFSIRREVIHPSPGVWRIIDGVLGTGWHTADWTFNFSPGLRLSLVETRRLSVESDGQPFVTIVVPLAVRLSIGTGWYSKVYGTKAECTRIAASWSGLIPLGGLWLEWRFERSSAEATSEKIGISEAVPQLCQPTHAASYPVAGHGALDLGSSSAVRATPRAGFS